MTLILNTSMLVAQTYTVSISNALTPETYMKNNQQWTILTGTDTSFSTINTLGLSQNTFELKGFNLALGKQIINSFDYKGKKKKDFKVYRNVYS